MREIKFRGWEIENKLMFSWEDLMRDKEVLRGFFGNESWMTNPPKPFWERMQFTGRKDKNGKEEYEGDIVRFYTTQDGKGNVWLYMYPDSPNPHSWIGVVEFEDGCFVVKSKKYEGLVAETPTAPENEIIGDIYQNPELL